MGKIIVIHSRTIMSKNRKMVVDVRKREKILYTWADATSARSTCAGLARYFVECVAPTCAITARTNAYSALSFTVKNANVIVPRNKVAA